MNRHMPSGTAASPDAVGYAASIRAAVEELFVSGAIGHASRAVTLYCRLVADVKRHLVQGDPDLAMDVLIDLLRRHEALSEYRHLDGVAQRSILAVLEDTLEAVVPRMTRRAVAGLPSKIMRALRHNHRGVMRVLVEKIAPVLSETERKRWEVTLAKHVPCQPFPFHSVQQKDHLDARKVLARSLGDADLYAGLERAGGNASGRSVMAALVFLETGRPREALSHLPDVGPLEPFFMSAAMEARRPRRAVLEADILEALGNRAAAQDIRLHVFNETLSEAALRAYLVGLPPVIREQAEEVAMDQALAFHDPRKTVRFLLEWRRADLAAQCIMDHATEWTRPDDWGAAEIIPVLVRAEPVAATVLLRGLVRNASMTGDPVYARKIPGWLRQLERMIPAIEGTRAFAMTGMASHASFLKEVEVSRRIYRRR